MDCDFITTQRNNKKSDFKSEKLAYSYIQTTSYRIAGKIPTIRFRTFILPDVIEQFQTNFLLPSGKRK